MPHGPLATVGEWREALAAGHFTGATTLLHASGSEIGVLGKSGPRDRRRPRYRAGETVRTHVRNAMDKLGARSRAQLVAKALGDGLIT